MISVGEFVKVYEPPEVDGRRWYVNDHTFFRTGDGTWHLVGITHAEPADPHHEVHLCHATAPSLHGPYTAQPHALTADPAWGETVLWAPHVIEHDGRWWMFVCGGGPPEKFRIQLATSDDGWSWTRHAASPLVVDGYEARDPMVRRVGDRWVMYYTATDTPRGGRHVVVAVTSDDLVTWGDRRVVYADDASGTGGGPTESPFVVERDGWWYLCIGPDWATLMASFERTGRYDLAAYRRSRVLASRDPFHFDAVDHVGTIDAHGAEVVTDVDGSTWVSHCGWGQRGVWLAPLTFSGGQVQRQKG